MYPEFNLPDDVRRRLAEAAVAPSAMKAAVVAASMKPLQEFQQRYGAEVLRASSVFQDRLDDVIKASRQYTPPAEPPVVRFYESAEWRTARHVESMVDLIDELRDQLAKSEERRAAAERAAAEAEEKRHSATVRATWRSAIVAAVVSVVLTVILTLILS